MILTPPDADFYLFFDESGTHESSPLMLAGAVEIGNLPLVSDGVQSLQRRALASSHLWQGNQSKRASFAQRGFHYTEDNAGVQGMLVNGFSELPFRSSVMFSRRSIDLRTTDMLINMYFAMVRNYARKHRSRKIVFVFEENSALNDVYSRIVASAMESLHSDIPEHVTLIGTKPSAGLSLVDYLLGIVAARLTHYYNITGQVHPYKISHYESLATRISHVLDFDAGVHRSRFRDIMFERASPTPST